MQARLHQEFSPKSTKGQANSQTGEARTSSSSRNAEGFLSGVTTPNPKTPMQYAHTHIKFT